jgi:hypothetical protein
MFVVSFFFILSNKHIILVFNINGVSYRTHDSLYLHQNFFSDQYTKVKLAIGLDDE